MTDYTTYAFHKQLTAFHEGNQELIDADVALVLEYVNIPPEDVFEGFKLVNLFTWADTPQGHEYWWVRHEFPA